MADMGYTFEMKQVRYYNYKAHNEELTIFDKDIEFSWQNEYRILVWPNPEGDINILIPGLKYMSVVIDSIKIPDLTIELVNTSLSVQ